MIVLVDLVGMYTLIKFTLIKKDILLYKINLPDNTKTKSTWV